MINNCSSSYSLIPKTPGLPVPLLPVRDCGAYRRAAPHGVALLYIWFNGMIK